MKTLEELKNTSRLAVGRVGEDGGIGEVHMLKWIGTVIWSFGGGWEHVSVSPYKRHIVPSWDDMCAIKNMFFYEDEVVVQYHPAKSEYVNVVDNCLHLWRPLESEIPVPNSLMVGLKKGQGTADVREFVKELEKDNTSTEHINKSSDCSTNADRIRSMTENEENLFNNLMQHNSARYGYELSRLEINIILQSFEELKKRREKEYVQQENVYGENNGQ